jgi:hypothetical protein
VTSVAVIVVELAPSANSAVAPATSVMPTTEFAGGDAVGGLALDGGVLGVVVLGGVVLDDEEPEDDSAFFCPPLPAFSQPAKSPTHNTRPIDTTKPPPPCHLRLGRTYGYLLL